LTSIAPSTSSPRAGFTLTQRGKLTASVRGTRKQYEEVFGTKLSVWEMSKSQDYAFRSFYFPKQGAPWNPRPEVANLIDDAYIQWPHIYMSPRAATAKPRARAKKIPRIIRNGETAIGLPKHAARALLDENLSGGPSLIPPDVQGFFLKMPTDVPRILNAHLVHNAGITGAGVTVVMIDSGFAHDSHPYFAANGYSSTVDLAPAPSTTTPIPTATAPAKAPTSSLLPRVALSSASSSTTTIIPTSALPSSKVFSRLSATTPRSSPSASATTCGSKASDSSISSPTAWPRSRPKFRPPSPPALPSSSPPATGTSRSPE
jgi:hypothetical protein